METLTLNQILCCIITIFLPPFLLFLHRKKSISPNRRLPPGPRGWPVFGNMFDLGAMPHRTMAGLKKTYGPVLWLKLGSINTMVVQSSSAAAELFKNHDIAFADRTTIEVMKTNNFDKRSVSLGSYGSYWRVMKGSGSSALRSPAFPGFEDVAASGPLVSVGGERAYTFGRPRSPHVDKSWEETGEEKPRIHFRDEGMVTVELVASKKISETVPIRRKSVDDMISWIREEAINGGKETQGIEVARFVFLAIFNMVGNTIFSKDLVKPESADGVEFFKWVIKLMELSGTVNIADLFPCLRWLDPQGLRRKAVRDCGKTIQVVSNFVNECLMERQQSGEKKKDYLETLLDYEGDGSKDDEPVKFSHHDINIHIMEVFIASAETTSTVIEWAMVELINNPTALSKLRLELDEVVGRGRPVDEDDVDNLNYLQAIVKETLRLHPPVPFLIPRRTTQDTNFMGYDIPKDTQVFVNVFAIGRDPENWDDPESFEPERFLDSSIDFKGRHFEFLPFGAGRRICPGIPLAHRMVHMIIGSMMHEFDWNVHDTESFKIKDMREKMSIVARKLDPLIAIPRSK